MINIILANKVGYLTNPFTTIFRLKDTFTNYDTLQICFLVCFIMLIIDFNRNRLIIDRLLTILISIFHLFSIERDWRESVLLT